MEAIHAGQKYDISRRMDWDKIGNVPYREIIKFRWCMEVDSEKQANDSQSGGSGQTLYSKDILVAGG